MRATLKALRLSLAITMGLSGPLAVAGMLWIIWGGPHEWYAWPLHAFTLLFTVLWAVVLFWGARKAVRAERGPVDFSMAEPTWLTRACAAGMGAFGIWLIGLKHLDLTPPINLAYTLGLFIASSPGFYGLVWAIRPPNFDWPHVTEPPEQSRPVRPPA